MVFHVYRKIDRKWEILFGENYDKLVTYLLKKHNISKNQIEIEFDIIPLSSHQELQPF